MSPLMSNRGSYALLGNLERPILELQFLVTIVVLVLSFKLLQKLINGHYGFERILIKKIIEPRYTRYGKRSLILLKTIPNDKGNDKKALKRQFLSFCIFLSFQFNMNQ